MSKDGKVSDIRKGIYSVQAWIDLGGKESFVQCPSLKEREHFDHISAKLFYSLGHSAKEKQVDKDINCIFPIFLTHKCNENHSLEKYLLH